jgi:murein DD-endopeptidase MepM/ murein hydrolase activator NlpD
MKDDPNLRIAAASANGGLPPAAAPPLDPKGPLTPTAGGNQPPGAATPLPLATLSPGQGPAPAALPAAATPAVPGAPTPGITAGAPIDPKQPQTVSKPVTQCDSNGGFPVYTILPGDTLSGIAAKFGLGNADVAGATLLVGSNKPDIVDEDDLLQIGQKLLIPLQGCGPITPPVTSPAPSTDTSKPATATTPSAPVPTGSTGTTQVSQPKPGGGVIHTVLSSQTLVDIANQYGVEVSDIVKANSMADPNKLSIGQQLFIPSPKKTAPSASAAASAASTTSSTSSTPTKPASSGSTGSNGGSSSGPSSVNTGPRAASGLKWPISGPISSYFGPSHPLGIDIDLYNNPNGPIGAAMDGTVSFAGGNSCCSYGLYVVVDHSNGLQTLYAHLSSISVTKGQKVSQGTVLGKGGRTGYATGNHLHFEVHVNGNVVNPLSYLP